MNRLCSWTSFLDQHQLCLDLSVFVMTSSEDACLSVKRQRVEASSWPSWGVAESHCSLDAVGSCKAKLSFSAKVEDSTNPSSSSGHPSKIATGIAFLDHMVDQLTAHAQLRVSLEASFDGRVFEPHSNEARTLEIDNEVVQLAGRSLGDCMKKLLSTSPGSNVGGTFRFCAPLDEALSSVTLSFSEASGLLEFNLAPFGIFPRAGRKYIGSFRTALTEVFFSELAKAFGCGILVRKIRGENAHHIVEATFKSFARCLRKALDAFCSFNLNSISAALSYRRVSKHQRSTKETSIDVAIDLDPSTADQPSVISTGVQALDEILREIQTHSGILMNIQCSGDLWIDDHHSAEDVCITLGKAIAEALGTKAGITRMGFSEADHESARVLCVMDLSNRPCLCSDLRLNDCDEEMVGDMSVEMIAHCFESLIMNALITVHLVHSDSSSKEQNARSIMLASARAIGSALKECIAIDPRRAGTTASSKGTLSK